MGIYEFGICMKDWAEDTNFGNHHLIGEIWDHGGEEIAKESKGKNAIYP